MTETDEFTKPKRGQIVAEFDEPHHFLDRFTVSFDIMINSAKKGYSNILFATSASPGKDTKLMFREGEKSKKIFKVLIKTGQVLFLSREFQVPHPSKFHDLFTVSWMSYPEYRIRYFSKSKVYPLIKKNLLMLILMICSFLAVISTRGFQK